MPLVKQHNTWAQAAGKGLSSAGNGPSNAISSEMENEQENTGSSASKVMRMEENVNESQIAAAFSEGWGQRGVNQDTSWEVPSSPHLSPKEGSTWTSSTSTGTEIWENNVRHHIGKNSAAAIKPPNRGEPWNHTPSTHLGGTWGEEEDTTHLWTGVPQASSATWGPENNATVWGSNPPEAGKSWENQNSVVNTSINPNWSTEPPPSLQIGPGHMLMPNENKNIAAMQLGLPHIVPMANENKNIGEDSVSGNGPPWVDPSHKANRTFSDWSPVTGGNKKMPPSGWEETNPPPPAPGQSGPNYDDGTAVWGNPVHQGKVSHWKEMPASKQMPNCAMPMGNINMCNPCAGQGMLRLPHNLSNMNKTDNASLMKNQQINRNLSWNEVRDPSNRRIWDDNSLSDKSVPVTPNAPNSAFANWGETGHPMGPYMGAKTKNANTWADGQVDTSSWGGPMKQGGKPLSKDLIWASKQFRLLLDMNFKKDDIENALRRNCMNFEDALMELHALNNKENSMLDLDGLNTLNLNQPRVHLGNVSDDTNFTEHSMDTSLPPGGLYGNNSFPGMTQWFSPGFNVAQNCKNQNSVGNNIAPNILGSNGTNNQVPNFNLNNSINNLSPAMMRKILQQTQAFNPACIPQNTGRINQQNFASNQLRVLVQQIQMAVQAGHLNPTILNQPLAPQTLQILYQLLQQIRFLHQLQQQQIYFSQHGNKPGSPPLQLSVQITQTKQHIANLQNQIAAQQALFLKQQVQLPVQHPSLQNTQPSTFDVVKSNLESINGLHSEFRDLSVKDSSTSQSHSRLTQWKMPSFNKEENLTSGSNDAINRNSNDTEFSRAPGSITKSSSANSLASTAAISHTTTNLQSLTENSWPDMPPRSSNDTWSDPKDSSGVNRNESVDANKHNSASSDNKDCPAASSSNPSNASNNSYNLNDLVPEFEPGKPWKGTSRIKNFEDDPHVTPGSIAKSPLSLNSIKDSDLFTWNTKGNVPNFPSSSSLTSSTWNFSPPPSSQNSDSSSGRSGNSRSWNNRATEQEQMSWKGGPPAQMPKTSRPPPGLSGQNKQIASSNWIGNESNPQGWSSNAGWEKQSGLSNFLALRNLTPQIDGSTLKTLCLQHGPLQLFHLILNRGVALVKYSTREETEKARSALNNCVLGNTTILVDIPTEKEVKHCLQLASGQIPTTSWPPGNGNTTEPGFGTVSGSSVYPGSTSTGNNGGSSSKAEGINSWNNTGLNLQTSGLWSYSGSGNGLWPMQSSGTDHDGCIPSSLNSFLPGDLLGGDQSM